MEFCMVITDFEIHKTFFAAGGFEWLCTDKGTRTICAIMLDPAKNKDWFTGPPYNMEEKVFDEYDMEKCYTNFNANLVSIVSKQSSHPNFLSDDVFKMMRQQEFNNYNRNVLKRDRVATDGSILHPYGAKKSNDKWYIQTFEIFTRKYSQMQEDDFIKLDFSTEEAMAKRKKLLGL